jgi:hypothetical protein
MWILNRRDTGKLDAAQMRFLRPQQGFTWLDHQRNADITEKLQVSNIVEEIQKYQQNWKDHLQSMDRNRLPKLAFRYQPTGRRWKNQEHPSWDSLNRPHGLTLNGS